MKISPKRWAPGFLAAIAVCLPGVARAGTINLMIGNFDLQFQDQAGGQLFDVANPALAFDVDGTPPVDGFNAGAQQVSTSEFVFNENTVALLMSSGANPDANADGDLFTDVLIDDLGASLTLSDFLENQGAAGGVIDWFSDTGHFLRLSLDPISYIGLNLPMGFGFFNFVATATVVDQNLPANLAFDDQVLVSFNSTDAAFLSGNTMMLASGSLSITGAGSIPEPAAGALVAVAAAACGLTGRRRG